MKKRIYYTIGGLGLIAIVVYNSIYVIPFDKRLAEDKQINFDSKSFVNKIWASELMIAYDSAIDLTTLLDELKKNTELTFKRNGRALGIGNIGYFRVKGEGRVERVNENEVLLQVGGEKVEIETEFIFGNAVRDASGIIKGNDNTADSNTLSESINDKIRTEVIPKFRSEVKKGSKVLFRGALELNKAHLRLTRLEVIPVSIQIVP